MWKTKPDVDKQPRNQTTDFQKHSYRSGLVFGCNMTNFFSYYFKLWTIT